MHHQRVPRIHPARRKTAKQQTIGVKSILTAFGGVPPVVFFGFPVVQQSASSSSGINNVAYIEKLGPHGLQPADIELLQHWREMPRGLVALK